jgi:8-oxo-dGTP pyrophosphatase MutT (NUDIX family)
LRTLQDNLPIFYNRRGEVVTPNETSVIKPRRGVFALAIADDCALLVWPNYALDVPDLPGGGIDEGENIDEAMRREWAEETGIPFNVGKSLDVFHHVRGFYAEDQKEFWIYDQTFRLYRYTGAVTPGERWLNPEGDFASWELTESLYTLPINRAHWCAIPMLLKGLKA